MHSPTPTPGICTDFFSNLSLKICNPPEVVMKFPQKGLQRFSGRFTAKKPESFLTSHDSFWNGNGKQKNHKKDQLVTLNPHLVWTTLAFVQRFKDVRNVEEAVHVREHWVLKSLWQKSATKETKGMLERASMKLTVDTSTKSCINWLFNDRSHTVQLNL